MLCVVCGLLLFVGFVSFFICLLLLFRVSVCCSVLFVVPCLLYVVCYSVCDACCHVFPVVYCMLFVVVCCRLLFVVRDCLLFVV